VGGADLVRSSARSSEALSEAPDARRLPHRDPRHDQRWEGEEADGVLELGGEGRVQVGDQKERGGQMDAALGSALLGGRHRSSSRTTWYSEA
jgi:hypothetical protein